MVENDTSRDPGQGPGSGSGSGHPRSRRAVLAAVSVAVGGSLAGCLGGPAGGGQGTVDLPTRLWVEEASPPASEGSVDPIVVADLPEAQREGVLTAVRDGEYEVPSEEAPPAVEGLRDRTEERAGDGLVVYLRRGETWYRVGFAAGDHIVAHPDPPRAVSAGATVL